MTNEREYWRFHQRAQSPQQEANQKRKEGWNASGIHTQNPAKLLSSLFLLLSLAVSTCVYALLFYYNKSIT